MNTVLQAGGRTPRHLWATGGFPGQDHAEVGLTEALVHDRDTAVAAVRFACVDRAVIDRQGPRDLELIADRRELIPGAHATGENTIEVIRSMTTAMTAGMDVPPLAAARFARPTPSLVIGMAAWALPAAPDQSAVLR